MKGGVEPFISTNKIMLKCTKCGYTTANRSSQFCEKCGAPMSEVADATCEYVNQSYSQGQQQPVYGQPIINDKPNAGFGLLAWFVPLFGLIYYCSEKNEKPNAAKTYGKVSLISFIVNVVLSILLTVVTFCITGATLNTISDAVDNSNSGSSYSYSYDDDDNTTDYDSSSSFSVNGQEFYAD